MAQGRLPTARTPGVLGVGMVVWLASELMFFAGLFAAWYALRAANAGDWPPEDVDLDVLRTGVATAVLIGSSFTMHLAVQAAERGLTRLAVGRVVLTAALGGVFLLNQVREYGALDFRLSSHAYGSIFFLMTGFHGLHVAGGIGLMLALTVVGTGPTRAPFAEHLAMAGYYWHFVDVVWVAMFTRSTWSADAAPAAHAARPGRRGRGGGGAGAGLGQAGAAVGEDPYGVVVDLAALDDPTAIAAGRELFRTGCVSCHGDEGQGLVGPDIRRAGAAGAHFWLTTGRMPLGLGALGALGLSALFPLRSPDAPLGGAGSAGRPLTFSARLYRVTRHRRAENGGASGVPRWTGPE